MCNNHDKEKVKASKIASSEEINHNTHRVPMEKYKETNNNKKSIDFELENHIHLNVASLEQKHHSIHSKTKNKS